MDTTLLLILEPRLRQLYHELLICENIEIVPLSKVENAIVFQSFEKIDSIVIYPDDIDSKVMNTFLHLEKKMEKFSKTRLILLTSDPEQYAGSLSSKDVVINITRLDPDEIVKQIKQIDRILIE